MGDGKVQSFLLLCLSHLLQTDRILNIRLRRTHSKGYIVTIYWWSFMQFLLLLRGRNGLYKFMQCGRMLPVDARNVATLGQNCEIFVKFDAVL